MEVGEMGFGPVAELEFFFFFLGGQNLVLLW